jgi:hypothetical protein
MFMGEYGGTTDMQAKIIGILVFRIAEILGNMRARP